MSKASIKFSTDMALRLLKLEQRVMDLEREVSRTNDVTRHRLIAETPKLQWHDFCHSYHHKLSCPNHPSHRGES